MITRLFANALMVSVVVAGCISAQNNKPESKATTSTVNEVKSTDTLVVKARLLEIPGTMPPNDLYNYVYIMKYRILSVEKGEYSEKEILVGHYNPLQSRSQIDDKMDPFVNGDVQKFEPGAQHLLKLVAPIECVWKDAVEDDYIDIESTKYFAVSADIIK